MAEGGANIRTFEQPAEQESHKPEAKERVYYADWIRAMAITLVIFVHCLVNSFDASGLDPDNEPTIQQKKDGIIKSLV
jgi:peptidoglycan/LPS O-acetylase OafA/YrhL